MKKLFCAVTCLLILCGLHTGALAAVGDVRGDILETDIVTEFCGFPIPAFAIDGKTLIAAEDLGGYGYRVVYHVDTRCLFVTYGQEPTAESVPQLPAAALRQPGRVIGQYYESDIDVFVNGRYTQGYALDGKMAICVEDICQVWPEDSGGYWNNNRYGVSAYGMNYHYDDTQRKLSFWNGFDKLPSKAEQKAETLAAVEASLGGFFNWTYEVYSGENMDLMEIEVTGTPHGSSCYYILFRNDNVPMEVGDVFTRYGINNIWGSKVAAFEEVSGNALIYSTRNEESGTANRFSLSLEDFGLQYL